MESTLPESNPLEAQNRPRGGIAVNAYILLTFLFWVGVSAQALLAGAGMFTGGSYIYTHIILGHLLTSPVPMIPLLLIIIAFAGKMPSPGKQMAGWLFLFAFLQPFWLYLRSLNPLLAALHPLNAMVIFALPLYMIIRARRG